MMTTKTRSRVCAFGSEAEMKTLCRALLENRGWLPESEQVESGQAEASLLPGQQPDEPELTLAQLVELVQHHSRKEGGEACTFFYDMVGEHPYGAALAVVCRFEVTKHPSGLWLACFSYGGDTPFQPEDWQRLHRQCKGLPMLAMYADWDFGLEKGMKIFAGGKTRDDWSRMAEVWLWLMAEYEVGYPPEEAVERLRKLRETLNREDFDMTIGEMLAACIDNLQELGEETADPAALQAQMQHCREVKDYTELFRIYLRIAETALWETAHNHRWIACLESVREAWVDAEGEDA